MSLQTIPKVRFEPAENDSGAIEAQLMNSGEIRIRTAADSGHLNTTWLTPAEVRELCIELLGLCDASEAIHA